MAVLLSTSTAANAVKWLQKAFFGELETVANYQTNAIVLDDVRAEEIKQSLRENIQEELTHAEEATDPVTET